jgi:hypothetical protein
MRSHDESPPLRKVSQPPADQLARLNWTAVTPTGGTATSPGIDTSVNMSQRTSPAGDEPAAATCRRSPPPTLQTRQTTFNTSLTRT